MKKIYTSICAILLMLFLASGLSAQLNGLYTINSGMPTGGSNFQTFAALANVYNTLGITGPVTVNVVANTGPYNEQVQFNQAIGTSPTNSMVIEGNGNTITFNATSNLTAWTICLGGADYVTINNLTILGTNPSFAFPLIFFNGADNNTISNCTVRAPLNVTTTNVIPIIFSGSNTTYASTLNSGNNNSVTSCTVEGGYFNVTFYGLTGIPYNNNNKIENCVLQNSYQYNVYNVYCRGTIVRGCIIERPNQTISSTTAGFYGTTGTAGALIENNRIRRMFDGMSSPYTGTYYGIACPVSAPVGVQNVIRNNIISDNNNFSGTYYGLFLSGASYVDVYHNDIICNDLNNTGASVTYGIFATGTTSVNIRNNIVQISRGGAGTKYCLYYNALIVSNNNNLQMQSNVGANYVGYYAAFTFSTLANWQTAGANFFDQQSVDIDPQFLSPGALTANAYLPFAQNFNALGAVTTVTADIAGNARSATNPDIGAFEFLNTPCSGIPNANSVLSPTILMCPNQGTSTLGFTTPYTVNGLSFAWQVSTISLVGPFTAVPNATNSQVQIPNPGVTSYYNAIVTCANGGGSVAVTASPILIAGPTTSVVPYFEDFEGVPLPNRMPNCSWAISNSNVCRTYTAATTLNRLPKSGSKFASFFVNPSGQNYYYTNGIQMNAGVTYSAALYFMTESTSALNWTDLSIMVGNSQSPAGLVTIASTGSFAVSPVYKLLDGTFTVPASGLYYIAIRATSSPGTAQYLTWDDLSVTVPCHLNTPTVNINAPATACVGKPLSITASGGSNTYSWSTGATGPVLTAVPNLGVSGYTLYTTDQASGCTSALSIPIPVYPSPNVGVFANPSSVCQGQSINLFATGANTYSWSNSTFGALVSVSPNVSTTYTVVGSNAFGCTGSASQLVTVNPNPSVNFIASANTICSGETATLTANGAATYKWVAPNSIILANPAIVSPATSINYTLTGTDANGCSSTIIAGLGVDACTGLNKLNRLEGLEFYPNPTSGNLTIQSHSSLLTSLVVTDITGKVILSEDQINAESVNLDLTAYANGIYYVKVYSEAGTNKVVKLIKN